MYIFTKIEDAKAPTKKSELKLIKPKNLLNLKLYFVSEKPKLHTLKPRIPESIIQDIENDTIKRVCFAPSIEQCLQAINAEKGKEYTVYVPVKNLMYYEVYKCNTVEVPYSNLTDEYWVLNDIEVQPLYKIKINKILDTKTFKYDNAINYKILEVYDIKKSNLLEDFAKLKEVKFVKADQNDLDMWIEFKDYKEARKFSTMCQRELNESLISWIDNRVYYSKVV